jgi:hypothetical protein
MLTIRQCSQTIPNQAYRIAPHRTVARPPPTAMEEFAPMLNNWLLPKHDEAARLFWLALGFFIGTVRLIAEEIGLVEVPPHEL